MQPILPLYAEVLNTAKSESWLGSRLNVATAEGLILTKMVAFRLQDQADIESLLIANRDSIDLELIRAHWSPFVAMEPDRSAWLENSMDRNVPRRK